MSDIDDVYGETDPEKTAAASRSKAAASVQSSLYRYLEPLPQRGKMCWDAIWLARENEPGREVKGRNARERLSRLSAETLKRIVSSCRKLQKKAGKADSVVALAHDVEMAVLSLLPSAHSQPSPPVTGVRAVAPADMGADYYDALDLAADHAIRIASRADAIVRETGCSRAAAVAQAETEVTP